MNDKTIQTEHKKWVPHPDHFVFYRYDGSLGGTIDYDEVAQIAQHPEVLKRMATSPEGYRAMLEAISAALRDADVRREDPPMRPASDELVCFVLREEFLRAGFTNVAMKWRAGDPHYLHVSYDEGSSGFPVYPHHRDTLGAVQELARERVIDAKMLRGRCSKTPDQEALEGEAKKNFPTLGAPR